MGYVVELYKLFLSMIEYDVILWINMIICYVRVGLMNKVKVMFGVIFFEKDVMFWILMI